MLVTAQTRPIFKYGHYDRTLTVKKKKKVYLGQMRDTWAES